MQDKCIIFPYYTGNLELLLKNPFIHKHRIDKLYKMIEFDKLTYTKYRQPSGLNFCLSKKTIDYLKNVTTFRVCGNNPHLIYLFSHLNLPLDLALTVFVRQCHPELKVENIVPNIQNNIADLIRPLENNVRDYTNYSYLYDIKTNRIKITEMTELPNWLRDYFPNCNVYGELCNLMDEQLSSLAAKLINHIYKIDIFSDKKDFSWFVKDLDGILTHQQYIEKLNNFSNENMKHNIDYLLDCQLDG
jgi:hypothetical protein